MSLACHLPISKEDAQRESRIADLLAELNDECNTHRRVEIWERVKSEITSRSPAVVRRMEMEKGLR